MIRPCRELLGVVALVAFAAGFDARAAEKVDVRAEVVLASNQGDVIDPPELAKMKEEYARNGIAFSSWRRQSKARVTLTSAQPQEVALPDGRKATLALEAIKEDKASVRVTIPDPKDRQRKLLETVYQLGRQGSAFIPCGEYQGGTLILVLSPPDGKRAGRTPRGERLRRGSPTGH